MPPPCKTRSSSCRCQIPSTFFCMSDKFPPHLLLILCAAEESMLQPSACCTCMAESVNNRYAASSHQVKPHPCKHACRSSKVYGHHETIVAHNIGTEEHHSLYNTCSIHSGE
uniref:Uncharacterized protein n=1 Tax=Opuntia streptacantha TaxID=393608 RepID=A0A7C9DFX9_OPUST